jgi:hypothetical protein
VTIFSFGLSVHVQTLIAAATFFSATPKVTASYGCMFAMEVVQYQIQPSE